MLFRYGAAARRGKVMVGLMAFAVAIAPLTASAETVIAALGDSLTQGYGLPPEDGMVPQLEAWLNTEGLEARVINAGVSGDTTAGGLSRVSWTLADNPDAMIVALGGNDLLRGIAPEETRANLTGILDAAAKAGVPVLLIGIEAPGNYGPDYKAAFDAIYPDLAERDGVTAGPAVFSAFDGMDIETRRSFVQPDGIHPSAEGVARIIDVLGPAVLSFAQEIAQDQQATHG